MKINKIKYLGFLQGYKERNLLSIKTFISPFKIKIYTIRTQQKLESILRIQLSLVKKKMIEGKIFLDPPRFLRAKRPIETIFFCISNDLGKGSPGAKGSDKGPAISHQGNEIFSWVFIGGGKCLR